MSTRDIGEQNLLNVEQFIDERRFSPYQWLILFFCFLIVALDGFDTSAIGFVAPAIAKEWGVTKIALGPVLSAALVGLAIGALLAGPVADRIGRRKVLIGSVCFFGVWTIACVFATGVWQLSVFRFLTGIGLGAALPNSTTLLSEYVPARCRSLLLNVMFCGFTLGASAGGVVSAALIPDFGWRSIFLAGGIAPVLLACALVALPESVRFMVIKGWPDDRIRRVLRRIASGELVTASKFSVSDRVGEKETAPLALILSTRYRFGTLMLWLAYFMGLLVYYMLTSWMPTMIHDAGFTLRQASLVSALFPAGGVIGALGCGWLMDRFNPWRVVALAFLLLGAAVCAMGQGTANVQSLAIATFVAGVCMTGAQMSMLALAALFYPTHGRASGVAWMLGIGRLGGILGALGGGALSAAGYSMIAILTSMAAPAFVAAMALLVAVSVSNKQGSLQAAVVEPSP
ncbi:MFS transporter [Paraburkholderia sp. RL17-347-BIC-D]|jgi:AAHS family 4-hydroxybenzoate transporter-like MFS transporter|uniref:MFS transporter n=1 Tax=Paraburkholderia sp. RL17-347-BIC-D TaxID=3031632 RepID=UPI0038BAC62F